MQRQFLPSNMSPLAATLSALVGLGTVVLLFFFGLIVGAVLLVVGVVLALYLRVRMWWLRRTGRLNAQSRPAAARRAAPSGKVIEGNYSVVDTPSTRDRDTHQ